MSGSVSSSAASPSPPTPTSSYHLRSQLSSELKRQAKRAAKAAVTDAFPEVAVPLELGARIARSKRSSASSSPPAQPILIPPREDHPLFTTGKERIRIVHKQGLTFVQVERAKGHGWKRAIAELALGIYGGTILKEQLEGRDPLGGTLPFPQITEHNIFGFSFPVLNLPLGVHLPIGFPGQGGFSFP